MCKMPVCVQSVTALFCFHKKQNTKLYVIAPIGQLS